MSYRLILQIILFSIFISNLSCTNAQTSVSKNDWNEYIKNSEDQLEKSEAYLVARSKEGSSWWVIPFEYDSKWGYKYCIFMLNSYGGKPYFSHERHYIIDKHSGNLSINQTYEAFTEDTEEEVERNIEHKKGWRSVDNLESQIEKEAHELAYRKMSTDPRFKKEKTQEESFSLKSKKNSDFKERIIEHDDIIINIPVGWRLYSDSETKNVIKNLNKNSEYKVTFDYYLELESGEGYPNMNILVKKSEEFREMSFNQVKKMFKDIYQVATEKVLDGTRGLITDHIDLDFIVDKENDRFFIISDGTVANIGTVRSNGAVILMDEYLININFAHTLENYKKYESALMIMANSVRKK